MDSNNYIIGGGITGLIWGFYNPEFKIIEPSAKAPKYLVLIHDTPATRKLLLDLGYQNPERFADVCKIGYCHNGYIKSYQNDYENKLSIQKKMTLWNEPVDTSFIPISRDMSTAKLGQNALPILNISLEEVITKLEERVPVNQGWVTKVNPDTIIVKTKDSPEIALAYDNLISTIAAPFFWQSYGQPKEFKCLPVTTVQVGIRPYEYDDDFGMIYYDDKHAFSRISKIGKSYFIEFTGEITEQEFREKYPDLPITGPVGEYWKYNIAKFGRIFQEENESPQKNITFSGRFAQWKFGITVEHVVSQCLDYVQLKEKV